MQILLEVWGLFWPWLGFIGFVYVSLCMISWAKKRKTAAITFGVLVQMFIPDPKSQTTIEAVAERKQEVKKQQDGNGQPKEDE